MSEYDIAWYRECFDIDLDPGRDVPSCKEQENNWSFGMVVRFIEGPNKNWKEYHHINR